MGAGWAFPMAIDATGSVALVRREREIEESIRLILGTSYGERPMRPEFGCGIHDFVFVSADSTALGRIEHEVRIALKRWEPRVDVVEVVATVAEQSRDTVDVDVSYSIKGSNDPRNLVFPFYVIPEHEGGA